MAKFCAVTGYPSGQHGAILPAQDYALYPQDKSEVSLIPYIKSFIDKV